MYSKKCIGNFWRSVESRSTETGCCATSHELVAEGWCQVAAGDGDRGLYR